jgi:signal transduction histidine kinase
MRKNIREQAILRATMDTGVLRKHLYGTWAVFTVALCSLLVLMLIPTVTAIRRSGEIYRDIRSTQETHENGQRVLERLGHNMFVISVAIREFFLDTAPDNDRMYLTRLMENREQLQRNIEELHRIIPPNETAVLQKLERELHGYWNSILPVFRWTPKERAERAAYFLREEQRPTRQSVLAIAGEIAKLNTAFYRHQQERINRSEREFRDDIKRAMYFALLAGVLVSAASILRIGWLERRAKQQHEQAARTGEELRHLSTRLRHVQEEERRTISRELHDEVGQKLTALRMDLGALERLRAADPEEFRQCLSEVKTLAEHSLRMIRDIAAGLRPSVLDDLGLGPAIQQQAREFGKRAGIRVSVSIDGDFDHLTDRQRTYIYRIVQEALTNCAKHSHARQIGIAMRTADGRTELTVADDGMGFDPARVSHSGLGLIGIEERARELGGAVALEAAEGKGTTIRVAIPMNGSKA